jgi:hypothetical protein
MDRKLKKIFIYLAGDKFLELKKNPKFLASSDDAFFYFEDDTKSISVRKDTVLFITCYFNDENEKSNATT